VIKLLRCVGSDITFSHAQADPLVYLHNPLTRHSRESEYNPTCLLSRYESSVAIAESPEDAGFEARREHTNDREKTD
jgi:hypothetical protein